MKAEPEDCSVEDVVAAKKSTVSWVGVRNYQARNFIRDSMQVGVGVLFYHSSSEHPGIVGIAQVASAAYPDPSNLTQTRPTKMTSQNPKNHVTGKLISRLIRTIVPDIHA